MRVGVIPCIGLGDGLISCVLAHNLEMIGHDVTVFHPIMSQLASFFPKIQFSTRPEDFTQWSDFDRLIFFYEKLDWMEAAIRAYPEKSTILNPIATPNRDYPHWEEGEFDGNLPFALNLAYYAKKRWGVNCLTMANGLKLPDGIAWRKNINRVIIHPTSSRAGKNWTKEKFIQLSDRLKGEGYEPVFILTKQEKEGWIGVDAPSFENLTEVAKFIAESGWMIGNDSGIGHLASSMGIPTLTICRSQMGANFWRPAWANGRVIIPPKWIPNIKGLRWRDQKWQSFIPVSRVLREFSALCQAGVLGN